MAIQIRRTLRMRAQPVRLSTEKNQIPKMEILARIEIHEIGDDAVFHWPGKYTMHIYVLYT